MSKSIFFFVALLLAFGCESERRGSGEPPDSRGLAILDAEAQGDVAIIQPTPVIPDAYVQTREERCAQLQSRKLKPTVFVSQIAATGRGGIVHRTQDSR